MEKIQKDMYDRALARQNELTYECRDIEEVKKIMLTYFGMDPSKVPLREKL